MDFFGETQALLVALESSGARYAVAGAVALAIHGAPRATADVDLLVPAEDVGLVLEAAQRLGFDVPAMPMRFSDGMEVRRVSKADGDELLTLDLLLVDEKLAPVFQDRIRLTTDFGPVWVVSRSGLIQMKRRAGREQDLADVRRLEELDR